MEQFAEGSDQNSGSGPSRCKGPAEEARRARVGYKQELQQLFGRASVILSGCDTALPA